MLRKGETRLIFFHFLCLVSLDGFMYSHEGFKLGIFKFGWHL